MEVPSSPPQLGAMNLSTCLPLILLTASSCSAQTVVLRLDDYANLSANETTRITKSAGQALAESGIKVAWVYCRGALATTESAKCESAPQANEIVMRLQPSSPRSSDGGRTEYLGLAIATDKGGAVRQCIRIRRPS